MERSKDIIIYLKSYASVTIQCSDTIAKELSNFFSAFAANYMWSPLYKSKVWDGKIRFFTISNNELPIGLVDELYRFASMGNYSIECTYERHNVISREEFQKFVDSLKIINPSTGEPMEPYGYQFECAYQCVCNKMISVEAATSAGKSLIIYILMRFMAYTKQKSLLICSQAHLVEQMFKDFQSYGWNAEKYCHRVYSGQEKYFDAPVTIVCWQSMITPKVKKMNPYEKFDCLLIDEAHGAKAKSVSDVSKMCVNAQYRYGFSGTYPDKAVADWFTITGSLGSIKQFASYKFLQDNGYITPLKIYNMILNYPRQFKLDLYDETMKVEKKTARWGVQSNIIHAYDARNLFITKMVQNLNENVLVLFSKKEAHGYILKEYFERLLVDKIVVYIDGDIPVSDREEIRKLMEIHNNVVLIGSYGCVSTGTNIKNLGAIIFASGYKSRVKTLQSIGRSLRLHKNKKFAKLFDIVDNCSFQNKVEKIKFVNYSMDHYEERSKFYEAEGWDVKSVKYQL